MLSMMADQEMEDDLLVVSDGHRHYTEEWTLDSACSHHYTPHTHTHTRAPGKKALARPISARELAWWQAGGQSVGGNGTYL